MDDPYKTLGVSRDVSDKDIRRAYLKLAKLHHPDLNPGNAAAEERFKGITAANDLLSDSEQRGRFDRGEIDMSGQERPPQPTYRDFADTDMGRRYSRGPANSGNWNADSLNDIFGSMFGEPDPRRKMAGEDTRYALRIAFLDAVNGTTRRLELPDGASVDVKIPPGADEGLHLRLRGKGSAGRNGGATGDLLIELHIEPHSIFRRDGQNLQLDLPVSFRDAVLGGQVEVPTPLGPVLMRIPAHSDSGAKLRLRGRGVPAHDGQPAGDLTATLRLMVGTTDAALEDFLRGWTPNHSSDQSRTMEATP